MTGNSHDDANVMSYHGVAGKSSVINALLGGKFLEDGILPTTNDISVLKFADSQEAEGVAQNQDGFYVRTRPHSNRLFNRSRVIKRRSYVLAVRDCMKEGIPPSLTMSRSSSSLIHRRPRASPRIRTAYMCAWPPVV